MASSWGVKAGCSILRSTMSWRKGGSPKLGEQTGHPVTIEAIGLPVNGSCGLAGFFGALGRRETEQHDRTDQFIEDLFRPLEEELELLPVLTGLDALALGSGHPSIRKGDDAASLSSLSRVWQLYVAPTLAKFVLRFTRACGLRRISPGERTRSVASPSEAPTAHDFLDIWCIQPSSSRELSVFHVMKREPASPYLHISSIYALYWIRNDIQE